MRVEVYADIVCAWSRLGLHRFQQAVSEAGRGEDVELVFRPFLLDPDAAEEPQPLLKVMGGMFGREQAEAMLGEMTRLGAAEGVDFRFDRALAVGTLPAHRLLWFALNEYGPHTQSGLANLLYDAHFRDGVNIADPAELAGLAEQAGLDKERAARFLATDEGLEEVRGQAAKARQDGITAAPTFAFGSGELLRGASETADLTAAIRRAYA